MHLWVYRDGQRPFPGRKGYSGALIVVMFLVLALVLIAGAGCAKTGASESPAVRVGEKLFKTECASCHGASGDRIPAAPLKSPDFLWSRGDATLIAVVTEGKGTMPAFGKGRSGPLDEGQIQSVVAFLNSQAGRTSVTELASAGEKIFAGQCARCHGEKGDRIPIAPLNAKGFIDTKTDDDLQRIVNEGKGLMPALGKEHGGPLSNEDMTAVVSFLRFNVLAQVARNVSRGRDIYVGQCLVCHGTTGDRIPGIALSSGAYLGEKGDGSIISAVNEGKGVMPAFGTSKSGTLAVTDIAALLSYLKASSGLSATAALKTLATSGTGGTLFAQNCAKCHGTDGTGVPGVQLFSKEFLERRGDALVKETITVGNAKGMPAWGQAAGGALSDEQIQGVIDFLKSSATSTAAPASGQGGSGGGSGGGSKQAAITPEAISKGKEIFTKNCVACHGETRDKIPTCKLADADWLKGRGYGELVRDITEGKPPIMPTWGKSKGGPLSDDQIKAISVYLWDAAGLKEADANAAASADGGSSAGGTSKPASSAASASPYAGVVAQASGLPVGSARGKVIFEGICIMCHGADGLARPACPLGSKEWLDNMSQGGIMTRIRNGKPAMGMPSWGQDKGGPLSEDDIQSVATFLYNDLSK